MDPGAVDDEASKKHVGFRHEEVKLATGGTGGATVSRKTPAAGPVAGGERVEGAGTGDGGAVPGRLVQLAVGLVAYQSEPLARNMPLALVKSTGLPFGIGDGVLDRADDAAGHLVGDRRGSVSGEKARL